MRIIHVCHMLSKYIYFLDNPSYIIDSYLVKYKERFLSIYVYCVN